MTLLNRDAILAAEDLKFIDVPVPEWNGSVRVQVMSGTQRDAFAASLRKADGTFDGTDYRAKLLARCIVGEDGKTLFSETDLAALNAKSTAALERVFLVADKLNATGADAVQAAEKN